MEDELPRQEHIDSEDLFMRLKTGMRLEEGLPPVGGKDNKRSAAAIGGSPRIPKQGVLRGSASVDIGEMSLDDLLGVKNN